MKTGGPTHKNLTAVYKTRNTEAGNGLRETRGMGGMLYFGECRQTLRGMSHIILENVTKSSEECRETFQGMSSNIPIQIRE